MADHKYRKALRVINQEETLDKTSPLDNHSLHQREVPLEADRIANRYGLLRTMENSWDGHKFYESSFNPDTGTLIRITEEGTPKKWFKSWYADWGYSYQQETKWKNLHGPGFYVRNRAYSPVPETIDVSINNWCNHGCEYCYTNATVNGTHAPVDLIQKIITGLDQPPYQIAYGGGSPTQHPDFIKILEVTRELGTVPNFTTEGVNLTDKILAASNELCGGIAITFHAFRGIDVFAKRYQKLRRGFHRQINIHLIADKNVATNLDALVGLNKQLGRFNIVLLAYYPEVGRSTLTGLMPKRVYMTEFPEAIKRARDAGNQIAFSEGLIPYFLSRPEIGIDTSMAIPTEGHFSCYVDMQGRMSTSSFDPPTDENYHTYNMNTQKREPKLNVYTGKTQDIWRSLEMNRATQPDYAACGQCEKKFNCSIPNEHHYFICNYASHNNPKAQPKYKGHYDTYNDWGF